MARSAWVLWHEHKLSLDVPLTKTEARLADAFAKCVLGYKRQGDGPLNERRLGDRRLRQVMVGNFDPEGKTDGGPMEHGRSFERARDGLVAKGLVSIVELGHAPKPGEKEVRTLYRLNLTPNVARSSAGIKAPAVARATQGPGVARTTGTKAPAVARARIGRRGKNTPTADPDRAQFVRRAFDAYLGAGGSLHFDRDRGALARQVATLVKAGFDERTILAACKDAGARQEFPGWIKQRAEAIQADGGPCDNAGQDRKSLRSAVLERCGCPRCAEWLAAVGTAA